MTLRSCDRQREAHWSEFCDECREITPHRHLETHLRDAGGNGNRHCFRERDKQCVRCERTMKTVEIPAAVLGEYAEARR